MSDMPLPEVLARVYLADSERSLDALDKDEQGSVLSGMTEVVRALRYFEAEGMIIVRSHHAERTATRPSAPSGAITYSVNASSEPPCAVCGQQAVVRESSCRTRCMQCGSIEGGCG